MFALAISGTDWLNTASTACGTFRVHQAGLREHRECVLRCREIELLVGANQSAAGILAIDLFRRMRVDPLQGGDDRVGQFLHRRFVLLGSSRRGV